MANKNTKLAVTAKTNDILTMLEKKLSEIKVLETTVWKTAGQSKEFGDIKTCTNVENLRRFMGQIITRKESYEKGAEALGDTAYPQFSMDGGTFEDWQHDIKLRKAILEQEESTKILKEFQADALKFLSEQEQKEIFFSKMEAYFNK